MHAWPKISPLHRNQVNQKTKIATDDPFHSSIPLVGQHLKSLLFAFSIFIKKIAQLCV